MSKRFFWFAYECPSCATSFDIESDVLPQSTARKDKPPSCPFCGTLSLLRGRWRVDELGYGSRRDGIDWSYLLRREEPLLGDPYIAVAVAIDWSSAVMSRVVKDLYGAIRHGEQPSWTGRCGSFSGNEPKWDWVDIACQDGCGSVSCRVPTGAAALLCPLCGGLATEQGRPNEAMETDLVEFVEEWRLREEAARILGRTVDASRAILLAAAVGRATMNIAAQLNQIAWIEWGLRKKTVQEEPGRQEETGFSEELESR